MYVVHSKKRKGERKEKIKKHQAGTEMRKKGKNEKKGKRSKHALERRPSPEDTAAV